MRWCPLQLFNRQMLGETHFFICNDRKLFKILPNRWYAKSMPYVINCDPACHHLHFVCNIDIRDTVNYKQVMKKYKLGPNGAIITSLNLFATQFDQVLQLIDKRSHTITDKTFWDLKIYTFTYNSVFISVDCTIVCIIRGATFSKMHVHFEIFGVGKSVSGTENKNISILIIGYYRGLKISRHVFFYF
jgi:hypothetical protein